MFRLISLTVCCALCLTACMIPVTGPWSFADPPRYGWTKAEVEAHWGLPESVSRYGTGDSTYETWLYRRTYFVPGPYGSTLESEWASVSFVGNRVVGTAH
jgi:hypothetical protein